MLFKIGNRIINTDNVTNIEFNPAPPPGSTAQPKPAALTVHFNYLMGQTPDAARFNGHEATSLWEALSQSAQNVDLQSPRR